MARDWNLHVINSHVAGAIGWSFTRLDAVWHEWILVALAVVIDDMLTVSAQCGCCPHFLPYFFTYALSGLFSLAFIFFCWSASYLLYVLWISSIYFTYNITWVALCILFPFSFLLLHGVYIVGIMGFVWWGVLFCCICTTTSLSIPCSPYNVYSSIFFLSCFVCLFLLSHMPLVLFFLSLCVFYPCLDENFWGVYA